MFTVIGARGFIGSALSRHLESQGKEVRRIVRGDDIPVQLGHVFFCAGLTADFRTRLHDTITAHVCAINDLLRSAELESLTYLSSTRVYQRSETGHEDSLLSADPSNPSDLYNLSKMTGEAICLADPRPTVRVVRLSNVYGEGDQSANFLTTLILEAARDGRVAIGNGRDAAKDYIFIDDAVEAISRVPARARSRIINVASGVRTRNGEIGGLIEQAIGAKVTYGNAMSGPVFPVIDNGRMRKELGVDPRPLEQGLLGWIRACAALEE